MTQTTLIKQVEGLELWTSGTGSTQQFAVKVERRRARVLASLVEAERYFAQALERFRAARAH